MEKVHKVADTQDKKEQKALSQVEAAREEHEEEEPEPARVRSADEEPKKVKVEDPKPTDASDYIIPKNLLPRWSTRQQVQDLMTMASDFRIALENAKKERLFIGDFQFQIHDSNLKAIHYQISECKPDVVCPECNGSMKDDMDRECKACRLTGFISKSKWHQHYEKANTTHEKQLVEARINAAS